jgi:hypothetical protein
VSELRLRASVGIEPLKGLKGRDSYSPGRRSSAAPGFKDNTNARRPEGPRQSLRGRNAPGTYDGPIFVSPRWGFRNVRRASRSQACATLRPGL